MSLSHAEEIAVAVAEVLARGDVCVDHRLAQRGPTAQELEAALLPLLRWCEQQPLLSGRGLVGLVGPPGAGKSHVAAWLAATAQVLGNRKVAIVSMDGYHLPNAELERRMGVDRAGRQVSLRMLKGTPPTFDGMQLLADLRQLKGGRQAMRLPIYSRELHDPVPAAMAVTSEAEWVFIEGNFLYLPESPWNDIYELLDRRIFVDAGEDALRPRLAARHARTGRDPAWFDAHYAQVDLPNIRLIRSTRGRADTVWTWGDNGKLRTQVRMEA